MSFDLCVWDKCNNRCLQCTNPDKPWPAFDGSLAYDYDSLVKRLQTKTEEIKKSDSIYITGGEPTIHPRFLDILNFLKTNFPKQVIKILTNGRAFAYEDYALDVLGTGENLEIDVSLYGSDENIHDAVTQAPGSFAQTVAGIKNLLKHKKKKQIIGLRFVLTHKSYQKVDEFLNLVKKEFSNLDRLIIIFPEYEAQAVKNQGKIMIKYSDVKSEMNSVILSIKNLSRIMEVRLYHFPLCVLDKGLWFFAWKTWPECEVEFLPVCEQCKYKKYCVGPHKGYNKHVGIDEFQAIVEKIEVKESGNKYKPILKVNSK